MPVLAKENVTTRTLESVFVEHNIPHEFEILSIDVEGHDYEVLRGVNLAEYRPRLIVIEMRTFSFEPGYSDRIISHLVENGYSLVAYYGINGFFLRKDSAPIV